MTPEMLDDEAFAPELPEVNDQGVIENEDGLYDPDDEEMVDDITQQDVAGDFFENIAEWLPGDVQASIASELLDLVEMDRQAREPRDKQYEEGIRRTGTGNDAPGGATFQGANKVVHPMLVEACVDFSARVIKEIWPHNGVENGPAKDQIIGEVTRQKVEKAKRKTRWMNHQLTQQMPELRTEFEQALTQVPLAGSYYKKWTWDRRLNRPRAYFIPIDELLLPYAAASFASAERKTHVQWITQLEYERRVASGLYLDVDLPTPVAPEPTASRTASEKVEGVQADAYNEDGLREVLEVYCYLELDGDEVTGGKAAPYIVTLDKSTQSIMAIYRNWAADDVLFLELDWIVELPMIPWRGAYPIGLTHMIGGLSGAATGALRALLDSAHLANSQTLVKLKGGSKGGQRIRVEPTQVAEIDGTPATDDIRKTIMALPFNQPSPVLFQLLGFLIDAGRGVVQTTMSDLADQPANQPVGTTLALIEQGMTVFNAIHARLHAAMEKSLRILHRLNAMYLRESDVIAATGEMLVRREDFEGPVDVAPVSDPNIFSEMQRFAQVQIIAQRAAAFPMLYDLRKVEERILEQSKIPNAKDLLIPQPEPQKLNPINENFAAALGRPIVAFPDQNHVSHLQVHCEFLTHPMFGGNPLVTPQLMPGMLQHLKEHLLYLYVETIVDMTTDAAGLDIADLMDPKDDEVGREFDHLMAIANHIAGQQMGASPVLQQVMQIIQGGMQYMQQIQAQQPPPPMTAEQVAAQEVMRKQQADQMKAQKDQADQQLKAQQLQQKALADQDRAQATRDAALARSQGEAMRNLSEERRIQAQIDSKEAMNTQDNQTALVISSMRTADGGGEGNLKNGTGIDPNPNP